MKYLLNNSSLWRILLGKISMQIDLNLLATKNLQTKGPTTINSFFAVGSNGQCKKGSNYKVIMQTVI